MLIRKGQTSSKTLQTQKCMGGAMCFTPIYQCASNVAPPIPVKFWIRDRFTRKKARAVCKLPNLENCNLPRELESFLKNHGDPSYSTSV